MIQTMLADRFKLRSHRASSVVPGYALVVAGKGSKLEPVSGDYEESLVPHKGKSTMERLAQTLAKAIEAPVVDKTGLTGAYEYEYHMFAPMNMAAAVGMAQGAARGPLTAADRVELPYLRLEKQ